MARYIFDIEANGLLDASLIHCIVTHDLDDDTVHSFEPSQVEHGMKQLMEADQIIGHNIVPYDLPTIQRLHPWFKFDLAKCVDTLVLSRLVFPNLKDQDFEAKLWTRPSGKMIGSHSLQAWGERFGYHKVEHEEWDKFSPEMLIRCVGDVEINRRLWILLQKHTVDPRAIELETRVADICARQERYGFCFDLAAAQQLAGTLQGELSLLESELQDTFPPFYMWDKKEHVGKRTTNSVIKKGNVSNKKVTIGKTSFIIGNTFGTWAKAAYSKIKLTVFNPGSRHHVANRLTAFYGWKPKSFTDGGQPEINEKVLEKLVWPEAQLLNKYFLIQKRLSLLIGSDEDKGWLNVVTPENKVHGSIITNGAVTGRGTHKIIANIPRVTTPYGKELRALFTASPGKVQVGIDVSGLELRMLAHYLAAWDDGAYGKVVCEGDVHTSNMQAAGLTSRDQAKTFIYAFLYGGGDPKIGSITDPLAPERVQRARGKSLKASFTQKTPGLGLLIKGLQQAATRGYLKSLDGRHIILRSSHSALNFLLQGGGSLICKRWMVEIDDEIKRRNWDNVVQQLIWYHDEIQFDVAPEYAEEFCKVAIECIDRAAKYFSIRVPLTGEAKIGKNWKECH